MIKIPFGFTEMGTYCSEGTMVHSRVCFLLCRETMDFMTDRFLIPSK